MNEAQAALLRILTDGPTFEIPNGMDGRGATNAARLQFERWVDRFKPLLTQQLGLSQAPAGLSVGGNLDTAGGNVAGHDINASDNTPPLTIDVILRANMADLDSAVEKWVSMGWRTLGYPRISTIELEGKPAQCFTQVITRG